MNDSSSSEERDLSSDEDDQTNQIIPMKTMGFNTSQNIEICMDEI